MTQLIETEAWVLHPGMSAQAEPAHLVKENFVLPSRRERDILVEPLFGCWEANMGHALERLPIDVCKQRKEAKVVVGNAGVVRILDTYSQNARLKPGQICMLLSAAWPSGHRAAWPDNFARAAHGYDAPGTVGLLAKQTWIPEPQLLPISENSRLSLPEWAAFSLRYVTAWANWKLAHGTYRLMQDEREDPQPRLLAWGGGVSLGIAELARDAGYRCAMLASGQERLALLKKQGLKALDRQPFKDLDFNPKRYQQDTEYKMRYLTAEKAFCELIQEWSEGKGAAIAIDLIGEPVFRATLKVLGWPGVISTAGWKEGMNISLNRALECMAYHQHLHTHYARPREAMEAMQYAETKHWKPSLDQKIYAWDQLPELVEDYRKGQTGYFPIFSVNPV
ncbi:zinc-binding dehydrogenase [bacterium (Candidatus Blackallbacteria) CG17_big_fil_post_rev_8_21_14_2_50_48_46]|uniref:Zinc-binding dehydrogenase n=1 Tax=bacterium (Candidatus Blackallbacteria) CG17_big_fil_post_rev_8_21_14_2_50_48_46 TaxID=2014261 RepID=A0A2M7G5K3_9BACT|nr:MAG: zinc-binding dehydrogenase [bacterium (Candidatus Blackallbacteria) CG18_big_fil_WC_8_21_14_2_50_49_26]PIW17206.1 MAG: zinc-binding dehydrogenase [bacterium (Candidatus Blackallbacteria) CG17_big_fil_post_rev_8_21_14_2_50_48_46]PIW50997.1 MAG: zinc-binding dehydrogenase [bacterium (Candidatus Blackallbacteria) CG13_big_fil_rev_8_21_14_2_50_49_14]